MVGARAVRGLPGFLLGGNLRADKEQTCARVQQTGMMESGWRVTTLSLTG